MRERLIPAYIQYFMFKGDTPEAASDKAIKTVMRMTDKRLRSVFTKAVDSGIIASLKWRDDIWSFL